MLTTVSTLSSSPIPQALPPSPHTPVSIHSSSVSGQKREASHGDQQSMEYQVGERLSTNTSVKGEIPCQSSIRLFFILCQPLVNWIVTQDSWEGVVETHTHCKSSPLSLKCQGLCLGWITRWQLFFMCYQSRLDRQLRWIEELNSIDVLRTAGPHSADSWAEK